MKFKLLIKGDRQEEKRLLKAKTLYILNNIHQKTMIPALMRLMEFILEEKIEHAVLLAKYLTSIVIEKILLQTHCTCPYCTKKHEEITKVDGKSFNKLG